MGYFPAGIGRALGFVLTGTVLAGCASTWRFADRPILWRDPDDAPIKMPEHQEAGIQWTGLRDAVLFPSDRALALDYGEEAWNVNALDEAPDSTWYIDRRRLPDDRRPRAFTSAEMLRGAFAADDPGPLPPYTVVKGKTIGSTPGLVIEDARHQRYLFKLDPPGWRGMNTSTEVVAARLAWAAGWLVPAELIVDVRPAELILAPSARTKDEWGEEVPLGADKLAALLARTPTGSDGSVRVCASRWLPGKNLGSFAYVGTRDDDPNDRIPHQNRRDVRGFGVFAAWVNDIDTMENNTMDSYVGKDGQGHVIHYQQDVGGSFGQFAAVPLEVWMGEETYFMPSHIFASILTLGILGPKWDRPGRDERRQELLTRYPELGFFDDANFDPRRWHPILDNPAFVRQTARDRFWGAKRVIAFSEAEVRAAVALGHYQPATAERLFQVLWSRRERVARAFLSDAAPLDYFRLTTRPGGVALCFEDLWIDAGLGRAETARYLRVRGNQLEDLEARDRCLDLALTPGYHIVELARAERDARPPALAAHVTHTVQVHIIARTDGARIVGVER